MVSHLLPHFNVKHIFIVSEGQTDFEIIKAVVEHIFTKSGGCTITPLFPTTQQDEDKGGWGNLRNWCKRQANTLVAHQGKMAAARLLGGIEKEVAFAARPSGDRLSAALFLHGGAESKVIIQLDTDVVEDFTEQAELVKFSHPLSASDRHKLGKLALDSWLGLHVNKVGDSILYCLSTHATETFLLATHSQEQVAQLVGHAGGKLNYDNLPKPERLLLALGYAGKNNAGVRKLRKEVPRYKEYAKKIPQSFGLARSNSKVLNEFCDSL